jgi:hypothetical protein
MNMTDKEKEILQSLKKLKSLDEKMKIEIICQNCGCTEDEIERVKRIEELRDCSKTS